MFNMPFNTFITAENKQNTPHTPREQPKWHSQDTMVLEYYEIWNIMTIIAMWTPVEKCLILCDKKTHSNVDEKG